MEPFLYPVIAPTSAQDIVSTWEHLLLRPTAESGSAHAGQSDTVKEGGMKRLKKNSLEAGTGSEPVPHTWEGKTIREDCICNIFCY